LTEEYGLSPQFVAGHSVGTFSAAVIAGVITLAEALAAVALRGRLMEEACADGDWGMAAVSGLPIRSAGQIAQQVATADDPGLAGEHQQRHPNRIQRHRIRAAKGRRCRRESRSAQVRANQRVGGVALSKAGRHRATAGGTPCRSAAAGAHRPLPHQHAGAGHHISRGSPRRPGRRHCPPGPVVRRHPADRRAWRYLCHRDPTWSRPHPTRSVCRIRFRRNFVAGQRC
jgi:hypothetical protein